MRTMYNISAHSSDMWSSEQREEAYKLCTATGSQVEILDVGFPKVPPHASQEEVRELAEKVLSELPEGAVAMVQGEMTLTYAIVSILKGRGGRAYAATTERSVVERVAEDGTVTKTAVFKFVRFRSY